MSLTNHPFFIFHLSPPHKKDFKKAKSSWPWALHSSYGMGGSSNLWVTFIQTCDFHFQLKGSEQIRREVERCCVQHSEILAKVLWRSYNLENLHEASAALDPLVWWNSRAAPSCTDSSSGAPSIWDIGWIVDVIWINLCVFFSITFNRCQYVKYDLVLPSINLQYNRIIELLTSDLVILMKFKCQSPSLSFQMTPGAGEPQSRRACLKARSQKNMA